jgi:hypothetical protein
MKAAWLLLPLALVACRPPQSGPVHLDRRASLRLRAPKAGPRLFATQQVVFRMPDGQEETLLTTVENDGARLGIVASTPLGQTLFVIQVEEGGTRVDARVPLPRFLDPRLLPALVQLANWPLEDLRAGLGSGMELRDEGPVRKLLGKGRLVLSLTREGDRPPFRSVLMELPVQGIQARITTLED